MRRPAAFLLVLPLALAPSGGVFAEPPAAAPAGGLPAELLAKAEAALGKGRELLRSAQGPDGSFGDPQSHIPGSVGYTAMVVGALVGATPRAQREADAAISKGLAYLAKSQKDNGAIYSNDMFVNYETSSAVAAFALARRGEHRTVQAKARDFLAQSQIAGDEKDPSFGGFPYKDEEPGAVDLSNVQFAVDALARAELPADSPVWRRVQAYLKRVQNLSEANTSRIEVEDEGQKKTVVSGDDGGAGYGPGLSKPGLKKRADGTWEARSYGSMTYALLKCLLLSGVDPKDARAVAALAWLGKHWTLERNPGFEETKDPAKEGQQGLYYFLFTAARTLALYEKAVGQPLVVKDADGHGHAWRTELVERLLALQGADGGWRNEASERWNEGSRTLASAYAVQALSTALGWLD